jgi:hypothetical protein
MTNEPTDIVLKHGNRIPGEWAILGVLDALPDHQGSEPEDPDFGVVEEMAAKMVGVVAPVTRTVLGRPSSHFGVTPLLIFREIVAQ